MKTLTVTDVRCQKGDSAFLIDDGKTSILYDTGFGFTGHAVAEKVQAALGSCRTLDYIFLTHSHYDHALGSAYVLQHFPAAKVVASSYTAYVFQREGAKRVMRELDEKFAAACGVTQYEFLGDQLRVDLPVEDGDIVQAGDLRFEILSLPGHTRCSIGFYCREHALLLSTETLGVYDGIQTIVPSFLVSYQSSIQSIQRVVALPVRQMLSPHFGLLTPEQTQFFLTHMQEASEQMAAELLNGIRSGCSDDALIEQFKAHYWHGYIREIYPVDAANLNTSIMINLIRKELWHPDPSSDSAS